MLLNKVRNILIFCLVFVCQIQGQLDSVRFEIYGTSEIESFNDLTISNDTIYAVGYSTYCGSSDMMIAVYDTSLNLLEKYNVGESYAIESLSAVASTNDTVYFAGSTNNTLDQGYDIIFGTLNRLGEIDNSKTFDITDWAFCNAINATNYGGFIGVGKVFTTDSAWNGLVFKVDKNLNVEWSKSLGGLEDDILHDGILFNDSILVLCGETQSSGSGAKDLWAYSCLLDGSFLWEKTIGEANDDWANSVIRTNDGGLAFFGTTASYTSTTEDTYLVKTDSAGNFTWSNLHQVQSPNNLYPDNGYDLIQLSNDSYIVFSVLQSFEVPGVKNISFMKTDAGGTWVEDEYLSGPGDDVVNRGFKYNDTTIFFCGSTTSYGEGQVDALIGVFPYIPTFKSNFKTNIFQDVCYTQVEEYTAVDFVVYPNPFKDQIILDFPKEGNLTNVRLISIEGKVVQQFKDNDFSLDVNTSVGNGVYMLSFTWNGMPQSLLLIRE